MKPIFKLSVTLLFNQFIADIASAMCVISFPFLFGESQGTYILFAAVTLFFYYYISYHGAYKTGFHDISRHSSQQYDKGYVRRGFLSSLIAALPSIVMFALWYIGKTFSLNALKAFVFPLTLWCHYGAWPLLKIFPNHMAFVFLICIATQILFPLVGYISGYKGIVYLQRIKDAFFSTQKNK